MDKAARIRAIGESTGRMKERKYVCKVKCQGCGKDIESDANLTDVEYVKTKRKTELFFHTRCTVKIWEHGIV